MTHDLALLAPFVCASVVAICWCCTRRWRRQFKRTWSAGFGVRGRP